MNGYHVDPAELSATAVRLSEAAQDVHTAATDLSEGAGGDLGPGGVSEAVDDLTRAWATKIRLVHDDLMAVARDLRTTRDVYADGEGYVADRLRRGQNGG